MTFTLHPQLLQDTLPAGDLPLCRVALMNNRHFPWLILVPRRIVIKELFDLAPDDYRTLMEEVRFTAAQFSRITGADKMNIASLGNIVPQLHIHIIARFEDDAAWPNPVWNTAIAPAPYTSETGSEMIASIQAALGL